MPENSTNQPVNRSANVAVISAVIIVLALVGFGARKMFFEKGELTDISTSTNDPAISTNRN